VEAWRTIARFWVLLPITGAERRFFAERLQHESIFESINPENMQKTLKSIDP
jgi:hypothetical protein